MRLRCGLTAKTRAAIRQKEIDLEVQRLGQWHRVFAWKPVKIADNHCRWLEFVERRYPGVTDLDVMFMKHFPRIPPENGVEYRAID